MSRRGNPQKQRVGEWLSGAREKEGWGVTVMGMGFLFGMMEHSGVSGDVSISCIYKNPLNCTL